MLPVIVMIGFIMRSPITTLPLILNQLADKLQVAPARLGILTTLPLVMFLIFSNFAAATLEKLGFKKSLILVLGLIVIGSGLRLMITMPTMLFGTALIGIGIAHLNVFMPALVTAYFPEKIGLYTTLYSFSMIFGNAVFNLITAPAVTAFGWKSIVWLMLLAASAAFLGWVTILNWLPEKIEKKQPSSANTHSVNINYWKNIKAWPFLLTFGGQATLNYTFTAWMPALMTTHHVSSDAVGIIMAVFALIGLPITIFVPQLLVGLQKKGQLVTILSAGVAGTAAAGMLFFQNTASILFWTIESFLIGYAICIFFIFDMTMFAIKTKDPYKTAKLSGMAQAGGYLISAFGPSLYGIAFANNSNGMIQNIVYIGLVLMSMIAGFAIVSIKEI